jgi:carbohydrate-selective porin OprB
MHRNLKFTLVLLAWITGSYVVPLEAADSTEKPEEQKLISLAEAEPIIYYAFRRYDKFYGDENTAHGGLLERSSLLGGSGGARDYLVDHGLYFDASITQFAQSNVSGGNDDGSVRSNGSADYWLTLDSGKAGLWSGGAVFMHAESSWGAKDSVNKDTGSLLPANFDAAMPTPNDSETLRLPELYLVQGLPNNLLFVAGKVDWAGIADTNVFANNERTQFLYTGLVNNPILGSFAPYTSIGSAITWAPGKHNLTIFGLQSNGNATSTGFDDFNGEYSSGGQYQYSPIINGNLPGNYRLIVGYSNKEIPSYDISTRHLVGELVGVTPTVDESENYTVLINFDQYLWIEGGSLALYKKRIASSNYSGAGRRQQAPNGIGIFGRAGWAPKDRNVIDQFYSLGIGGYGMLIPGRDYDQWGIGWSGTHISSDFRDDTDLLGIDLNSYEHAVEAFYNFQLTPAAHLTVNAQVIDSMAESVDTAKTLGARLQLDF